MTKKLRRRPEVILGIWGYSADRPETGSHDSGAALIIEGRVAAAANEERFTRRKNESRFPAASIEAVLKTAGLSAADVEAVAMAELPPRLRSWAMLKNVSACLAQTGIFLPNRFLYALLTAKKWKRYPPKELSRLPLRFTGHHHCHAAAAYYTSPYQDATVVTLDGIGDGAVCGSVYRAENGRLQRLREFNGYYSIGIYYSYVTKHFGFRPGRHEGKITGLAAYGNSETCYQAMRSVIRYDSERRRFVSRSIPRLFGKASIELWSIDLIDELVDKYGREDVAAALQRITEEEVSAMAADAVKDTGIPYVCLAGGVFANVRVNQVIQELPDVKGIYVHPHMGDGGLATGAALDYYASIHDGFNPCFLDTVYLGPPVTEEEIERELRAAGYTYERPADIAKDTARRVAEGTIVGRFDGRMEYGPRALGHRTILASAGDRTINDWLNQRLKRTEFMPFAPVITEEAAPAYLVGWEPNHVAARFMTVTYRTTERAQRVAPAVVHLDGTARPQVIRKEDDPVYHAIVEEYGRITGEPILINTSFNVHEEPIVGSVSDALRSLEKGAVDELSIGPFRVLPKREKEESV